MGKVGRVRGRQGAEGGERVEKWEGELDMGMCPGGASS